MDPTVSVVIPSFNYQQHISSAVESVLSQSYKNVEVLIIDDASTDDSVAVINRIRDPRLKLIKNPHNLGLNKTLNRGFHLCHGEFICYLDADDLLLTGSIERRVQALQQSQADVVHAGVLQVTGNQARYIAPINTTDSADFAQFLKHPRQDNKGINSHAIMVRKSRLMEVGLRDESGYWHGHEDYEMSLRLLTSCRTVALDTAVYQYTIHEGSMMQIDAVSAHYEQRQQELEKQFYTKLQLLQTF